MRGERNGVIAAVALFLLWSGVFDFRNGAPEVRWSAATARAE